MEIPEAAVVIAPTRLVASGAHKSSQIITILMTNTRRKVYDAPMDEGRKRTIGVMAAIMASLHMRTADDLFGGPQGSPRSDKLISASIQWAEKIMEKIDDVA